MKCQNALLFRIAALAAMLGTGCVSSVAQTQGSMQEIGKFNGTNGSSPVTSLIELPNGNLLGVTLPPERYPKAAGTIYQLSADGKIQVAYRLATDGSQGALFNDFDYDGVTQASDGKIYGIVNQTSESEGIVYRFTLPTGPFEILHSFELSDPADGLGPVGNLVQAPDGNLYGVCNFGGNEYGDGTIFRVGLDGSFANVFTFPGTDPLGSVPRAGLVLHPDGLLYGFTTEGVGSPGALYQLDPASGVVQALVAPSPAFQSSLPPIVGQDAGLYFLGGESLCGTCLGEILRYGIDGSGPTVEFTFSPSLFSGLYNFLLQASDGSFLGGAIESGTNTEVIFRVDAGGQTVTTYSIPQQFKEQSIVGNLTQGALGGIVGALFQSNGDPALGAIEGLYISLPKPLPSVAGFSPSTVAPGATFAILGNHYVGVDSVTLNGQVLPFTVMASGAITVTAPQSPVSGPVVVASPAGSTTSSQTLTVQ